MIIFDIGGNAEDILLEHWGDGLYLLQQTPENKGAEQRIVLTLAQIQSLAKKTAEMSDNALKSYDREMARQICTARLSGVSA